jgi:hypothetical protein
MRAILHIGTEKTGTTSFQRFMNVNTSALLDQKILYPSHLGGENHRHISIYALDLNSKDDGLNRFKISSDDELAAYRAKVEQTLTKQVAASDADVCVLSSEHLHSRLKSVEQIQRVHDLLSPLFSSVEVYLHLRPQVDVIVSLASTQARVGSAVRRDFFERPDASQIYYNYNLLTEAWETVFGAENMRLLSFRQTPDFLGFMMKTLGIDISNMATPARVNEAIDVRVMAMVNALTESGSSQRIDHRVIDLLPVQEKVRPSLEKSREIQQRFSASNRALIARRDDLQDGSFLPAWKNYPDDGNLSLLDQPCPFAKSLADMIAHYNTIIDSKT